MTNTYDSRLPPEVTDEQFRKDVAGFEMEVLHDQGLYRHLCFRNPRNWNRHFYIVTWPNFLMVTGDMGEYAFERTEDMFTFFRRRGDIPDPPTYPTNPGYWSEKLVACDKEGPREFNEYLFRGAVVARFREYWEGADRRDRMAAWTELREDVLERHHETEHDYVSQISELTGDAALPFQDWEWAGGCHPLRYHVLWALKAIVFAIDTYDARKSTPGS